MKKSLIVILNVAILLLSKFALGQTIYDGKHFTSEDFRSILNQSTGEISFNNCTIEEEEASINNIKTLVNVQVSLKNTYNVYPSYIYEIFGTKKVSKKINLKSYKFLKKIDVGEIDEILIENSTICNQLTLHNIRFSIEIANTEFKQSKKYSFIELEAEQFIRIKNVTFESLQYSHFTAKEVLIENSILQNLGIGSINQLKVHDSRVDTIKSAIAYNLNLIYLPLRCPLRVDTLKSAIAYNILYESYILEYMEVLSSKINLIEIKFKDKLILNNSSIGKLGIRSNLVLNHIDIAYSKIKQLEILCPGFELNSASILPLDSIKEIHVKRDRSEYDLLIGSYNFDSTRYKVHKWDSLKTDYKLIALYTNLIALYNTNGDSKSKNLAYIAKKNIENKLIADDYAKNPSLEIWFELNTNRFLSFFCSYGTEPSKALIYSFYVIFFFSLFYCIFPSEQDNLHLRRIKSFFDKLLGEKNINSQRFMKSKISGELKEMLSRTGLNKQVGFMAKAVIYLTDLQISFLDRYENFFYYKVNKKSNTLVLILSTVLFLLSGLIMRSLNAIALSLNAFVTLGYGEIHAKGISRYMAVLEGVIGWFLLSIFSVSLISQLMQ